MVERTTATISALETLKLLNQSATTTYSAGVFWLQGQSLQSVDLIAGRIRALTLTADSAVPLIPALDLVHGGWGGDVEFEADNIDTAVALQALKTANYSDIMVINHALNYLTTGQNADGGWGFTNFSGSNIAVTAMVSATLQKFPQTTAVATAINKATNYLLAHQKADGGFGQPTSTVYETALAYMAIVALITDATTLSKAVGFLTSNQSVDGSWLQDPYCTALALQALHYSTNKPTPPQLITTGEVIGKVVSAATNEPLAGVTVYLAGNPALTTLTDNAGVFSLFDVPQGSPQIFVALDGYITTTVTTTLAAGTIINLGTLPLAVASPFGIVRGVVTDAATESPLPGAQITVTGNATWTTDAGADGGYKIVDITPGEVTLSVTKAGYASISAKANITAGQMLDFSPALSTTPPTASTGEVRGGVVDAISGMPIAGATITLTSMRPPYVATASVNGRYTIANVEPGVYGILFSAVGYYDSTGEKLAYVSAGGVMDMGTFRLRLAPSTSTIIGKVTDSATEVPIADAEISIIGTDYKTKTDTNGDYLLTGINLLEYELKVSAINQQFPDTQQTRLNRRPEILPFVSVWPV